MNAASTLVEFIGGLQLSDLPASAECRLWLLLADMASVCVAGRPAPASRIAADHAAALHPGDEATLLYDDRRVGAVGAAFANGVLANALDFDDGHRLTKGHPGAVVIPAALAAGQLADADLGQLLAAIAVGYEVSIRAGIALHRRDPSYHASGAWGGLGAAAAAARLLGLDAATTLTALGLAEYHAPIAPIMRSCAEPAMTKDACAWGASVGVSSALLARRGFTSVAAEFVDEDLADLGQRWCIEELYVKPYPCCRWSQGAIALSLSASGGEPIAEREITAVRVHVFAAADGLAKVVPADTEQAQYNVVWPVSRALVRGDFSVAEVLGPFDDADSASLAGRVEIVVDPELDAAFPARRLAKVEVELHDGRTLLAGPSEAPGEPDDPAFAEIVEGKVARYIDRSRDVVAASLNGGGVRSLGARALLGLLCSQTQAPSLA